MMTNFNSKQKIAILLSPVLFVVMFGVYQAFAAILGSTLGWYAGFAIYWPIFCVVIPFLLVGSGRIIKRYKIIKIDPKYIIVYLFPVLMTLIGGFFMSTAERDMVGFVVWLGMSVGNGVFKEILWRGTYPILFPDSKIFGFAWPAVWFSIYFLRCRLFLLNRLSPKRLSRPGEKISTLGYTVPSLLPLLSGS